MKHIQKIVKITCLLKDKFNWSEETISDFIKDVGNYTYSLRQYNEALIGQNKPYSIVEARQKLKDEVNTYLDMMLPVKFDYHISNNVMECPIRMDLGKEYANYEDNKSFVIDL